MLEIKYSNLSELAYILDDFKILFAYNSNKIENPETNYNDTREIFENGKVSNFTGNTRTLFEIQNQKECFEKILKEIVDKRPIDVELIKEIHQELTKGTYDEHRYLNGERPGEFKKGDYIVGIKEVGSNSNEVEKDIKELVEEINNTDSNDCLTIAAYFHCRFENIHAFADGNGRVGRTLLNYYLLINSLKPLIVYEEDKKLYYECLREYDDKQNIEPMKKFIEYEQEKTWSKKENANIKLNDVL